jgi:hypothetical protein
MEKEMIMKKESIEVTLDGESYISLLNYHTNLYIYNNLMAERTRLLKEKPKGYRKELEQINEDMIYIEEELTIAIQYHVIHGDEH